ncbi:prolipoprotein diacylglyceryl transferase [Pseudooceanicola atlanticus]|uniref:Phosphatidylglycerol--prolipoprotein diacylglyceryl transferase n=1 Tax=Pseudooceanicola atlanticus TaxID=1461694 RepID=A0A0A0EDC1_9RHOB|nr:prolipoprotein diacylglyceryl transferase [Pseudooceanicola atlanticus]KGM48098.1 diacylglyceryl transferase [Pseudooceanicola atlanticus]
MIAVIPFPDISPEVFSISAFGMEFALRWYALAYMVGIGLGWFLARTALGMPRLWPADQPPMTRAQLEDLMTWIIVGIILGGRLGFVLFYQPGYYLSHPAEILMIWQGGMAFHGGFLGVALAWWVFCARNSIPRMQAADMMALATPVGIMLGRIANFINAELWGRPTDAPWGVIFPVQGALCDGEPCARHPSQLYEAGLEGLLLGSLLIVLAFGFGALRKPGLITGLFVAGYGAARFVVEFFRLADAQYITPDNPYGHVLRLTDTVGITMGQMLSLPMVLAGLIIIAIGRRQWR